MEIRVSLGSGCVKPLTAARFVWSRICLAWWTRSNAHRHSSTTPARGSGILLEVRQRGVRREVRSRQAVTLHNLAQVAAMRRKGSDSLGLAIVAPAA